MPRRLKIFIIAGGAMLAPLLALGHGLDCIQAQLSVHERRVRLDVIAEYAVNPLLEDEAEAAQVLEQALFLECNGRVVKLRELSDLRLTPRDSYHPSSPLPLDPADAAEHQLIGASWEWQADTERLRFAVPEGSIHNVMLWEEQPDTAPRWVMLLGGEKSPWTSLAPAPLSDSMFALWALFLAWIVREAGSRLTNR